jgi:L-rhamnose isomerase / sugar isomerase
LIDAYATDVRPLCAKVRVDVGAAVDPIAAFKQSGYAERVAEERAEGVGAGWG